MKRTKLSQPQAAARVGVSQNTWRPYVARGQAPAPDGYAAPCGCPWWWDSTVDKWIANRPGRGRPRAQKGKT